ncbi:hypothetical protein PSQ39_14290 [Curvibacter sp. HBC28]|uniref:DUF11 domain-containing protein n=1 Tax=Curvibacter microcysteis TaxID=3026419 RepID=A0ABT5MGW9_9BURK|nr:hypothetical protein [Curvibacter sp. HBC28]MDD0815803.1 hypothetical protein [Curvibacter sp. HBC28]
MDITPSPELALSKVNPASLTVGLASDYTLSVSNTGSAATSTVFNVFEQLPPFVAFNSAAGLAGGTVTPSAVSCSVVSGTVASGQLLNCTVNLPTGLAASTGTTQFKLNVTPQSGVASSVVNKAQIDSTGANAAQAPSACTATGTPAGCAVTASQSVGTGVNLGLSKANPATLAVGATSAYTLTLSNTGTGPSGNSLDVYEQLPVGVGFANAAGPISGGTDTPSGVSCVTVGTGTVTSGGQLLKCTLTFSAGIRAVSGGIPGSALFSVSVKPEAAAANQSVINRAAVDSTGGNAAQNPASCTGQNTPSVGCAVSPAQTVQGTVTLALSKTSPASGNVGGVSSYALLLSNTGNVASGNSLVVYDELPQNLEFYDIQPSVAGSVQPSASSCSVSGSAANNPGQSLICSITIPGGIPAGGSAGFHIRVLAKAGGTTGSNKAAVDPSGNNAAQTPGACLATGSPAGCAVAPGFSVSAVGPVVSLFKGVTPSATSLRAGVASTYRITIGNSSANSSASAQSRFVFSDQLPPGFDWIGAIAVSSGSPSLNPANPATTITPSAVLCSTSGTVVAGLLVTCSVDLPSLLTVNSFAAVDLQIKPRNSAIAFSATNKARIDSTGFNAPQGSAAVAACSATDSPMGCAVSTNTVSAGSGAFLELTKEDPATLTVGVGSAYTITVTNKGVDASGTSIIELYDKLPANVAFISAAPTTGGSASASSATCAVQSGSGSAVATGELLKCTLNVGTGGIAASGSVKFVINVMPNASVSTTAPLSNKAAVDATGGNSVADPTVCTALNTPNPGCTVSPGKTVGNGVNLGLGKANPATLAVGATSAYTLTLSNTGTGASGNSIDVYEQLPVGVGYANVAAPVSGGTVTPTGVTCSVQSGDVSTGQLLKCTVSLSAGIPASTGTAKFSVSVTPTATASGNSVVNKAAVDSTGGNAAQTPANCTGTNTPTPGCTTSAPQTVGNGINLSLSKTSPASGSVAALSSYTLQISNTGAVTTGTSLTLLDQLPQNMQFFDIAPSSAGSVTPSSASCSASGSASSSPGQLLTCTVGLASGLASGATAVVTVRAQALASGTTGANKASVDPAGGAAAPTPSTCTATGTPAGCAVAPGVTVSASGPVVTLFKSAFPLDGSLKANAVSTYRIAVGNNDSSSTGPAQPHLEFYDLLWPGFNLVGASVVPAGSASRDPVHPTTSVAANTVSCSAVGGSVAAGLLVKCAVDLPSMLAVGQNLAVDLQVLPGNSATAFFATNKARIDATGFNAPQSSTSVSNCSSTGAPMGCAVTTNQVAAGSLTQLGLSKENPANLAVGLTSSYTLTLSNTGGGASGNSIDVYEQLPVGVGYTNVAAPVSGGTVTPTGVTCSVQSGDVSTGQLLKCTVSLSAGIPASTGTAKFSVSVTPTATASGNSVVNKAAVDSTGGNAAQTPANCTGANTPTPGCTTSAPQTVGSGVNLGLSKTNPASLTVGVTSAYTLTLSNTGSAASGNSIDVYDQLPVGVGFANVAAPVSGGTVTPSGVSCSVQSGDVTTGQLLKCTVSLSAGLPASTGSAQFSVSVTPVASASGSSAVNRAAVDSTGSNAAQTPANCTGTNTPTAGCAATPGLTVSSQAQLQLTFNTLGGNNTFAIGAGTGGNGFTATTLTTTGATGTPAQGTGSITPQGLNTGASTVPFNVPAGWSATGGSCTVSSSGGAAAPGSASFAGTGSTGTFSFDATATTAGNVIRCQATLVKLPIFQLSLLRQTGSGSVTFTTQPSATAGNGYTAQSFVSAGASSSPVPGSPNPVQVLAAASSPTQLSLSGPAGWVISSASCVDANSAASGNPSGTFDVSVSGGTTLALTAGQVPAGANLVCTATVAASAGQTVSGLVLQDNGAGGGTAHDGVKNGAEAGRPGVTMTLGNCSGTTYASTVTDGEGRFSLSTAAAVPGPVCLVETSPGAWVSVSNQAGNTAGSFNAATRSLNFTLAAGTDYSGIVFGEVPISLLTGDGRQQLQPGQSVVYGHSFLAGTSASVVFSTADQPSPSGAPWTSTLYLDNQCNASLDASDTVLNGPVSVTAGQTVCLLVRVFSPASAASGSTDQTTLTATETYQPTPQVGSVVRAQTKVDVTTVGVNASGALTLLKEVRKVATCPSTVADTLPFSASNTAMPGSFLEYRLSYANGSSGPVTGIQISDAVPAYTGFQSAGCGTLPQGLASCTVTDQPALGATGPLVWKLTDNSAAPIGLQSGGSGSVLFCVRLAH